MSTFTASNSIEISSDTTFYYLGQNPFSGSINPVSPDWTAVVDGYTSGALGPFTSQWIVSGTGGTGKIKSIKFNIGDYDNKTVDVTLEAGGGVFRLSGNVGNTYSPPSIPCFVEETQILTNSGYKAIEKLTMNDLIITSDNRSIRFKLYKTVIEKTTSHTAPYYIERGALGNNMPTNPLQLSPSHKVQIRKSVWISPEKAAETNPRIYQYGIGEKVSYYHIECDNYLQDNIIANGMVVESFGTSNAVKGLRNIYTWNNRLKGFTRIGHRALLQNK